jgi:hypothetical protein
MLIKLMAFIKSWNLNERMSTKHISKFCLDISQVSIVYKKVLTRLKPIPPRLFMLDLKLYEQ